MTRPQAAGLLALGDAVLDQVELDGSGRFRLMARDGRAPNTVWVSAPGRALLSATIPLAEPLALQPQAVIEVRVTEVGGQPAEDAMALVLADGVALPLPPVELVADTGGVLRALRLPAGVFEILVASADGQHFARKQVRVDAGETLTCDVQLGADPDLRQRFLRAAGVPDVIPGGVR